MSLPPPPKGLSRPQLSPGTSHSTTRYEVEFMSLSGLWTLDANFTNLADAKARMSMNISDGIDSRVIVVSETRRIVE